MQMHAQYLTFLRWAGKRFRRSRMKVFAAMFLSVRTIVDFGGADETWPDYKAEEIVLLNVDANIGRGEFKLVIGDGRHAPFEDKSFELAFSNSVIEHMELCEDQKQFAREMMRVGRSVYCQTPNRWFPIEPHVMTPFVHWLPKKMRTRWLYRYFTPWGWLTGHTTEYIKDFVRNTRLLTRAEMQELFPNAEIIEEKVCGICKSFVAEKSG
jgi:ubiquinone/menaquinone biosynthesis C-methylase UbiE